MCRFFDKNRNRKSKGFWLVVPDDGCGLCLAWSRMQGGQSDSMTVPEQRPMHGLLPCELFDGQQEGSILLVFPLELRPDAARRRLDVYKRQAMTAISSTTSVPRSGKSLSRP